jgi:Ser/Thr protein kinase RdoA (MazF antagonist)
LTSADVSPAAVLREGWFDALRLAPLGEGHINETLLVETGRGRYVLQRISDRVFPDPQAIADKVQGVIAHLQSVAPGRVPALEPTRLGGYVWRDGRDGLWRLWRYVENTRTLQQLENAVQAHAAGRAFGELQTHLRNFACAVADPVPGFMQLDHYLGAFDAVVDGAPALPGGAEEWFEFVGARRDLAGLFAVRDRLVHADCKVDNLLFHAEADEVVSILDLDTVMFGNWAWDFGDLVRSAATWRGTFSIDRFRALVQGFVSAAGVEPSVDELLLAPRYVAFMLGVRFLTDHLQGDRYFRIAAPGDNLHRARYQFALLQEMEREESRLRRTLQRF